METFTPRVYEPTEAINAAHFSDRGLIAHLNGAGWLIEGSVTGVIRTLHENSPDDSIGIIDLGLSHVPGFINIFLNIEHRQ